ncbi:MAG: hypothetical protein AAB664_03350, partial [Patescibacteria group bacterium]
YASKKTVPYQQNSPVKKRIVHLGWIGIFIPLFTIPYILLPTMKELAILQKMIHATDQFTNREQLFRDLERVRNHRFIYDEAYLAHTYQTFFADTLEITQTQTSTTNQIKQSAIAVFQSAVKKSPLRANLWYDYSILYMLDASASSKTIPPEVFFIAEQAKKLAPPHIEAQVVLANLYELNHDIKSAMTIALQALETAPNDPELLWSLGSFYAKNNEPDKAAEFLHKSLSHKIKLRSSSALHWLINYEVEKNNTEQIVFLYKKSVDLEPNNHELLPKLAAAYAMNHEIDKAIETAESYKRLNPEATTGTDAFIQQIKNKP